MHLTVLGGSSLATPQLMHALLAQGLDVDVTLHGRSEEKLAKVLLACRKQNPTIEVVTETSRERALQGADIVLNQVRIGGLQARAFDESFPHEYALPGEETLGPGGFANAARTIVALREIWREIERHAPEAIVINLTNPAGMVKQAVDSEFSLRVISVCDAPEALLNTIATRLARPVSELRSRYVGLNHVGWYVPDSGQDLRCLSDVVSGIGSDEIDLFQAVPLSYLRYYLHPKRCLREQLGRPTRAEQLLDAEPAALAAFATGTEATANRKAVWYEMSVVPVLKGILENRANSLVVGHANGTRLPWLPSNAVIETEGLVMSDGEVKPGSSLPDLPPLPLITVTQQAIFETIAVEAILNERSGSAMTRAMFANPMVRDIEEAQHLVAAMSRAPGMAAAVKAPARG